MLLIFRLLAILISVTAEYELLILHTNDVHARFELSSSRGGSCKSEQSCYGGVARRAGLLKKLRKENNNVLLLDAGDQFQGTPWFYTYKGELAHHFLEKLKYDAMCLGNHEFDNGLEGLKEFLKPSTFNVLCSNLIMDDNVPDFMTQSVKKHIVKEIGGKKIGIIGYITHKVPSLSKTENLNFMKEEEAIRIEAAELKKKSVDIIIAVGHAGLLTDLDIMKRLPEVNVFVGGHSHTLLYKDGTSPNENKDVVGGSYPEVYTHTDGSKNLVLQAGSTGKYLGKIQLTFDEAGKLLRWEGNPVLLDDSIDEDPDVKAQVVEYGNKVKETFDKQLGSTEVEFITSENICRVKECLMGNLYADAMIEFTESNDFWKVDMALVNGGSFRHSFSVGQLTYGDAVSMFPFSNDIVIMTMLGSLLFEAFEHSVSGFSISTDRAGKFLQISGVMVTYDMTKPNGQRVKSLQVKDKKTGQCTDVNLSKEYKVMLPSYVAGGGDGFSMFEGKEDKILSIDVLDVDIFTTYLQKNSPITAREEGRLQGLQTFMGWSDLYQAPTETYCPSKTTLPNEPTPSPTSPNGVAGLIPPFITPLLFCLFLQMIVVYCF